MPSLRSGSLPSHPGRLPTSGRACPTATRPRPSRSWRSSKRRWSSRRAPPSAPVERVSSASRSPSRTSASKRRLAESSLRFASGRRHNPTVTQHQPDPAPGAEPERGFIVAVLGPGVDRDEELGELRELLKTAGVDPVGELVQHRQAPDPRTYVGKGKLRELVTAASNARAESLIVDDELDPGQQRRLEDAL